MLIVSVSILSVSPAMTGAPLCPDARFCGGDVWRGRFARLLRVWLRAMSPNKAMLRDETLKRRRAAKRVGGTVRSALLCRGSFLCRVGDLWGASPSRSVPVVASGNGHVQGVARDPCGVLIMGG